MKTILRHRGIGGLLFAQSQVAFTDNASKLILIGLVQILLPPARAGWAVGLIALLLVTPFVIFAPLSGWLSDRFPRRHVIAGCLWLQLGVMAGLLGAVFLQSLPLAIGGFFFLGLQSALMSPARRGMVKDLAGDSVGEVVGWMEMLCIVAILAGSLAGGQMIDSFTALWQGPWPAAVAAFSLLALGCGVALWIFRQVPSHPTGRRAAFGIQQLFGHRALFSSLRHDQRVWRAAWGDAVFYLGGGIFMLTLSQSGRELFPDGVGAAQITGRMMATMGGGIAVGSVVAARINRDRIVPALILVGALGLAGVFFLLIALTPGSLLFFLTLFLLGLCAGLYLVPLGALLLTWAPAPERGKILAASSMLSSVAGMVAVGLYWIMNGVLQLGLGWQFAALGVLFLLTAAFTAKILSQDLFRFLALAFARLRYRVTGVGVENLPAAGGALIVCNHVSYVDTVILSLASPRPIRFLSYADFFRRPILGKILHLFGAIPVSPTKARDAIVRAAQCVSSGELVCIFPEGQLTRTGCLMELKSGFELIARRAQCPVIVAQLDGLWGSIYSYAGERYFFKRPQGWRRNAIVSFAPALEPAEATASRVREAMLTLGEAAFRSRTGGRSLGARLIKALAQSPGPICVEDSSGSPAALRSSELLALAALLARRWRNSLPEHRIGIILPPGRAGTLANLAVLLAGKVPVNLNPSLSPEAARSCLAQSGVETILTTQELEKKLPKFPWPDQVVFIETELATISAGSRILSMVRCRILPPSWLERWIGLPASAPDDEAVLLFTSGSSGLPKGVPLTQRNLLANLLQISETGFLRTNDRLLSALPLFHSFGLTMGLLFPLLAGRCVVTAPSPLDHQKLATAAKQGRPTVLLTTPTFLRSYARRMDRDVFGTLRLIVTGAEHLPADTDALVRDRFGCEIFSGYGLTEAAPVVSLNMPNPALSLGANSLQDGAQTGSVGRILPGLAMRLLDPETGQPSPGATRGVLALRGPNLVNQYLHGQDADAFRAGWFITGDVVRLQPDGFLFLEGRLSRFSKIAGEMVSHLAVEVALRRAFVEEGQDCVLGRPNPEKGEELVLLTTRSLKRQDLHDNLDLPNLWIPRHIVRLQTLPLLGSGKLDLAACRQLAASPSEAQNQVEQAEEKAA